MSMMVGIHGAVLLGVVLVLPLVTVRRWWWPAEAAGVVASLAFPIGPIAAVLASGWVAAAVVSVRRLAAGPMSSWSLSKLVRVIGAGYAVIAGTAFVASRGGVRLFGIGEPIVELTSVHFTYAGAAAMFLGAEAVDHAPPRLARIGLVAAALTAAGPPIVATGFVLEWAVPQVGGAVVMALGVVLIGSLHLVAASDRRLDAVPRVLLGISGAAVWVPMGLAVAWAAGQHWDVPALSIPDMVRTHGSANAVGFIVCGLAGRALADRRGARAADAAMAATSGAEPTYDHVGSTLHPAHWPGRQQFTRTATIGGGRAAFDAAVDGLATWVCQRGLGATIHPPDAGLVVGTTLAVELPAGPVRIIVPNRVVEVVDEPDRFGFAYGTLPGHQERGEEGFLAELDDDGDVTLTIRVDAVPATLAARLAGPVVTAVQHIAVGRYLDAWLQHVAAASTTPVLR